jgi:uncharacterized protein YidB (DUF937 family)
MGLFDQVAGQVLGSLAGKQAEGAAKWLPVVMALLKASGGIAGLKQRFEEAGLAGVVASWIGQGGNQELKPEALEQAVGPQLLSQLASQFGLTEPETAGGLARFLPQAIDQLTPNGGIETDGDALMEKGMAMLGGLLGGH